MAGSGYTALRIRGSLTMPIEIRPYRPEDRSAVHRIAYLTGYMGEPIDWLWSDEASFCNVMMGWYTDEEPGSIFVADAGGEVVGYLAGCDDSQRVLGNAASRMGREILRGALVRPGIAGFLWRSIADLLRSRGEAPEEIVDDPRWPAHLHINLLPQVRGQGAGGGLMHAWLIRLREQGSAGVHLGTFAENLDGQAFFRSQGFESHGSPQLTPGFRTREGKRMHVQWMVQSLSRT